MGRIEGFWDFFEYFFEGERMRGIYENAVYKGRKRGRCVAEVLGNVKKSKKSEKYYRSTPCNIGEKR